jgi:hypothetical protein
MKEPELAIPPDLFRGTHHPPRNDRYAVYRMLSRRVSFGDPVTGVKVVGYVEEVYRDIFTGEVRLTVQGRQHRFKEPVLVRELERELVFVYGDVGKKEVSDEKLFYEMKKEQYHETATDTLRRLAPRRIKETRFSLGDKKPSRRKPFLMRGIQAAIAVR